MNCGDGMGMVGVLVMIAVLVITLGLLKVTKDEGAQEFVMFFMLLGVLGTPLVMVIYLEEQEHTKITQDGKVFLGDYLDSKLRDNVKIVDIKKSSFGENSDFNKGLSRITLSFSDGDSITINEDDARRFRGRLGKFEIVQ